MAENTGNNSGRRGNANLKPWVPGQSGNPKGRRKGQRDYKTLYWIALCRIGEANGLSPEMIEEAMHAKAIERVIKNGDFFMYKELNERVFGKVKDGVDITFKDKTLADVILAANNARKRPTTTAKTTKRKGTNRASK